MQPVYRAMSVAGSDSGGGAGIQADLKTFAAHGVYGASVLTAITAQNTTGVTGVLELPASLIESQFDAVISDIGADVVKTGMLSSADVIEVVVAKARQHRVGALVVDPVMVAKGGDKLLRDDAIDALRSLLVPIATVITPNVPEAEALLGGSIETIEDAKEAARALTGMGARAAVVKGGHLSGPPTDILYDGVEFRAYTSRRIDTTSTHGTGCTFASAIAANLARGQPLRQAVSRAKSYVTSAIRTAQPIGRGHGPLNHFYMLEE